MTNLTKIHDNVLDAVNSKEKMTNSDLQGVLEAQLKMAYELGKKDGDIKSIIEGRKKTSFVPEYQDKATDEEALGLVISNALDWDGLAILKTSAYALEDANFHKEYTMIMNRVEELEKRYNKNN